MGQDYRERIGELMDQAWAMDTCPARLALEEEAIRIADSHQDVEEGFHLRDEMMNTAVFSGFPERALVAFSWLLAQSDRAPERFPEEQLMWKYKWIANELELFPQLAWQQIEDTLSDMERRYQRCGMSLKPIWKARVSVYKSADRRKEAQECYKRWRETRADFGNDCVACDRSFQVTYLIYIGRRKQALKVAEPLLDRRQGCATVPHSTFARVLQPLLELGELDRARHCQRTGYPMVADNQTHLDSIGHHIVFLAQVGDHAKAVKLLEKHITWVLDTMKASEAFQFYLSAFFLCRQMLDSGKSTLNLRLPKAFPLSAEDGKYALGDLAAWFDEQCRDLAARFDARNNTGYFARRLLYPTTQWKELVQSAAN